MFAFVVCFLVSFLSLVSLLSSVLLSFDSSFCFGFLAFVRSFPAFLCVLPFLFHFPLPSMFYLRPSVLPLILSLTVITLTVGVIDTTVFEYKNQVMFNMTVFDGGPRCQIDTCF